MRLDIYAYDIKSAEEVRKFLYDHFKVVYESINEEDKVKSKSNFDKWLMTKVNVQFTRNSYGSSSYSVGEYDIDKEDKDYYKITVNGREKDCAVIYNKFCKEFEILINLQERGTESYSFFAKQLEQDLIIKGD